MRFVIIVLALMWVSCASAQISNLFIHGQVHQDQVEFYIENTGNEDCPVHHIIVPQDDILMLVSGDTIIPAGAMVKIDMRADSAEYRSFVCTITLGTNLRTTSVMSKSLTLLPKNKRATFMHSSEKGGLSLSLNGHSSEYFKLVVYDFLGKPCFRGQITAGVHSFQTGLSAGWYIARIGNQNFSETVKVYIE